MDSFPAITSDGFDVADPAGPSEKAAPREVPTASIPSKYIGVYSACQRDGGPFCARAPELPSKKNDSRNAGDKDRKVPVGIISPSLPSG